MTQALQHTLDAAVPLFTWMLRASWQAAVLALLVLLVQWILGRHISCRWRCALWLLVLVRLVMPAAPSSPLSIHNLPALMARPQPVQPTARHQATSLHNAIIADELPADLQTAAVHPSLLPPPQPAAALEMPGRGPQPRITGTHLWMGLWLAGAAVMSVRVLRASIRLARSLRRFCPLNDPDMLELLNSCQRELGIRRNLPILVTDDLATPALMGFLRPRLLMPRHLLQEFNRSELRLILLHELAHLVRRDVGVNWLIAVLQAIHWFNPVLALAFARMRADRELACDELVLSLTRQGESQAYGQTIIKLLQVLSRRSAVPGAIGILENAHPMRRRISMIAQFRSRRHWSFLALLAVVGLAAVALTDRVHGDPETAAAASDTPPAAAQPAAEKAPSPALPPAPPPAPPVAQPVPSGVPTAPAARPRATPVLPATIPPDEILQRTMPEVRFDNVPLSEVVEVLRDLTGLNFFVDWKVMESEGIDAQSPVTIRLNQTPLDDVLRLVLRSVSPKLTYRLENNTVIISTRQGGLIQDPAAPPAPSAGAAADAPPGGRMFTTVYDVSNLVMPDEPADPAAADPILQTLMRQLAETQVQLRAMESGGANRQEFQKLLDLQTALQKQIEERNRQAASRRAPSSDRTKMQQLVDLLESTLKAGNPARPVVVKGFNAKLVVTGTETAHREIQMLLEVVREKPQASPRAQ